MREHPILFSSPMVRAILAGTKTQTRRHVKRNYAGRVQLGGKQWHIEDPNAVLACTFGQPGDRLWVRETWAPSGDWAAYAADYAPPCEKWAPLKWRPSIHMPRKFSRITLEITDVRVQRVQEISEVGTLAEGISYDDVYPRHPWILQQHFRESWNRIYPGSWERNEWVWAITFRRMA